MQVVRHPVANGYAGFQRAKEGEIGCFRRSLRHSTQNNAVNRGQTGTKAAGRYQFHIGVGETATIRLRLISSEIHESPFGADFDGVFASRIREADEFYVALDVPGISDDARDVQRQAFAV